jgi:hypothetical protein
LEQELEAARKVVPTEVPPEGGLSPGSQRELYWKVAVPLTLVLVASDLLAASLHSNPAMLGAVRGIQEQSQKLLEAIRGQGHAAIPAESFDRPNSPQSSPPDASDSSTDSEARE